MTDKKELRLSKLAREFNVGITTIVDFLKKKGFEIESNPNTKVAPELLEILSKEYSSDLNAKKESEKVNLRSYRDKKDIVTIDDQTEEIIDDEETSDNEILITDTSTGKKAPMIFEPKKEFKDPEIKIVGKIDIERISKPKRTQPEQIPEIQNTIEPQSTTEEIEPIQFEVNNSPEVENNVTEVVEEIKVIVSEPDTITIPKEEQEPEEYFTTMTDLETDIRVVGKIDLDSLNQRTRPPKKTKEQRQEERKERFQQQKQTEPKPVEQTKPAITSEELPVQNITKPAESRVIRAEFKKLAGPTIVGKIILPGENRPATEGSSADESDKHRKKRKRIKKDKEKVTISDKSKTTDTPKDKKSTSVIKKEKPGDRKKRHPLLHTEVNEVDVQKQIKDTLARLTSKGGKSKASKYRREKREIFTQRLQEEFEQQERDKNILKVTEFVSVNELASMMNVPANEVIATCMSMGLFVSINQRLDAETMALVADEFNYKVEFVSIELQETIKQDEEIDKPEELIPRPPIAAVMGHVDHGKTKLLDYIRNTNVIAGEAGGITQHIGAYGVKLENGRQITFLDTPGHEAFTAMRARGAKITDVAIIVVAADDGVMPQTKEAINHASAAGVPIIFAINKVDKPEANPEKIKEELANLNYMVEDWGGKYQSQEISAKTGLNIELLLEKVLLEAEMLDLKANPNKKASGTVIESSLDRGRGFISTVLVEHGTLKNGDIVIAGNYFGHVKAMYNERNIRISEATPATPVLILGLDGAPQAGDTFNVMTDIKEAKDITTKRGQLMREQGIRTKKHITLDEIGRRIAIGNFQELNVIVKGDVDGSVEALSDSLIKLSTPEIQVNVIHKAVGQISESDILLAAASNAIIVGFQVRPSMNARKLAEKEQIDIRLYSIIYDAIEEIKAAMEGMLSPEIKEEIVATIEIREVFKITKVGSVAGCYVKEGKITRNTKIRIIRDGIVIYSGELGSLKRFKDDVKEVTSGYECGLNIHNFNDLTVGDIIEGYHETEVKKKL
jgi:translation initiation factor IF-2